MEKIFGTMEYPDNWKVACGAFMLIRDARFWWEETRQLLVLEHRVITWDVFRIKFLEKYVHTEMGLTKETEFLQQGQGDMTTSAYATEFEELIKFKELFLEDSSDERKYKKIEEDIKFEIRKAILSWKLLQFPTLRNKCRSPQDLNVCQGRKGNSGPLGYRDNKKLQKKPFAKPTRVQLRRKSKLCERGTGESGPSLMPPYTCMKCGKGHATRDCVINGIICFKCGKPGYLSRECDSPE